MLDKQLKYPQYTYDNSTVNMRIESTWSVFKTTTTRKDLWLLFARIIKKRISKIISRFDVPKIPPHMINQLGIEKEATSTN